MASYRIIAALIGLIVTMCSWAAAAPPTDNSDQIRLQRYEFLQIRMAIPVRITVYAADEPSANKASQAAYSRIKQIDRLLSHYDPDSELSQLCKNAVPGRADKVGDELFTVLSYAQKVSEQTDGAFDVTVGPLMDLWRQSRRKKQLPAAAELKSAQNLVGYHHLQLDAEARTVTFEKAGMQLDLGGIAKGYAADEALRVLKEHGVSRALIDAGGDIVASDPPPDADSWLIGIAPLDRPDDAPEQFLKLTNAAVATSGDASQHVEIDGTRYSHILDPATGLGLTTHSSVTVVAGDGITADALASAVSVLGPEQGLELLTHYDGADALIVVRDLTGIRQWKSLGLSSRILTQIEDKSR